MRRGGEGGKCDYCDAFDLDLIARPARFGCARVAWSLAIYRERELSPTDLRDAARARNRLASARPPTTSMWRI